jgi:hypothetical protein
MSGCFHILAVSSFLLVVLDNSKESVYEANVDKHPGISTTWNLYFALILAVSHRRQAYGDTQ